MISTQTDTQNYRDLIIIGSGPAGYTAAIYAGRAELEPLVIAGAATGGQLMLTTDVENYPGFPDGVTGPEMMDMFRKQAERFGATVLAEDVERVDLSRRPFRVWTSTTEYAARSVIVSTGASAMWLDVPGEEQLRNRGVSACATCDGFFFRGKRLIVVGGGDVAMEEATFLTRFAESVTVVHRRHELRASKSMQRRALENPKISFVYDTVVEEILGSPNQLGIESVSGVRVRNVKTGAERVLEADGVFVAIGHKPSTELFVDTGLELDPKGYIAMPDPETAETNIPGVFAAGDVRDYRYRQAITAAGDGCKAAMDAERWLEEQGVEVNRAAEVYTLVE